MSVARTAVSTFEDLDGFHVTRVLGRISARVERPRRRLYDALLKVRAFVGLQSFEFLSEAERARSQSLDMLLERANSLGAHAIVGLRFRVGRGRDGGTHVMAMGRAVLLHPIPSDDMQIDNTEGKAS